VNDPSPSTAIEEYRFIFIAEFSYRAFVSN
jgi:hypothetical protein